jgi:hypothetical protein
MYLLLSLEEKRKANRPATVTDTINIKTGGGDYYYDG